MSISGVKKGMLSITITGTLPASFSTTTCWFHNSSKELFWFHNLLPGIIEHLSKGSDSHTLHLPLMMGGTLKIMPFVSD